MIGVRNSLASRFSNKNPNVYISGCPCHLAHIAASHVNDAFNNLIGFNIENVCIDSFYWFDKSTKRKGKLWNTLNSIRWLTQERCIIGKILNKYSSLKSYFLSQHHTENMFNQLHKWFSNGLLEPALSFQSAIISIFTSFNRLLQRDEPTIHLLKPAM